MSVHTSRVVVLVDMDCFYCQVEERLDANLTGKPIAVVQYNAWKGGGIIAVNYPARDRGVTRHMRGDEAKQKCPEIELVRVPNIRGKADLTKYREAGKRVAEVLQTFTSLLQRASVDEAYLDITEAVNHRLNSAKTKLTIDQLRNTHVVGCETKDFLYSVYNNELSSDSNIKLAIGGAIVEQIRATVYEKTGYRCSAGIAHNKILAKLACGLHKPNQQTILPQDGIEELYRTLPIKKIKSLGGKFGESLTEKLNITYMSELTQFSEQELLKIYDDKTASWLYNIGRGIDLEPVTIRLISKSIGCCKKFPGKTALRKVEEVTHWLSELAIEIAERLEQDLGENNRRAKQIVVSFAQQVGRKDVHSSKTQVLNSYDAKKITTDCFETLKKYTQRPDGSFCLKFLGISAGKFEDCKNVTNISTFFKPTTKINKAEENVPEPSGNTSPQQNSFSKTKMHNISTFLTNIKNKNCEELEEKNTVENINSNEISVNDIENDVDNSDLNLDETLKDLENIKNIEDNYSDTTTEADYNEILKTKEEFPGSSCSKFNIATDTSQNKTPFGDTSKSFFMRYIQNMNSNKESTLSKSNIATQNIASCSNIQNNINIVDDNSNSNTAENIYDESSRSSVDYIKKECPDCHKKILEDDYTAHLDYHMAMKLMEEEKKLFREQLQTERQKTTSNSPIKNKKTKSAKRKSHVIDKKNTITSFFSSNTNKENDNNASCSECGKFVTNEDLQSHLDFHAAKKLHGELNPVRIVRNPESNFIVNKKKKSCTNTNKINSISNFFKPVQN